MWKNENFEPKDIHIKFKPATGGGVSVFSFSLKFLEDIE